MSTAPNGIERPLIACRYPDADVAREAWERLSSYFSANKFMAISSMRCVGRSDHGETHLVVAAGFTEPDGWVLDGGPWGDEAIRCDDALPEPIKDQLYSRVAHAAATLAAEGQSGTFTTRRPHGARILIDADGNVRPESNAG
ncbi:MAG TPA: hypothetical protein VF752_07195 [Thermoleophilaceae bacterium]